MVAKKAKYWPVWKKEAVLAMLLLLRLVGS
jgi:hypothetical protein